MFLQKERLKKEIELQNKKKKEVEQDKLYQVKIDCFLYNFLFNITISCWQKI